MRIELTTSSLPRKCSTPELQQLNKSLSQDLTRAEDEGRTRNLQLGRLSLYQLSYFRITIQILVTIQIWFWTSTFIYQRSVGRSGFEPLKSKDSGFTVRPIWPLWNLPDSDYQPACRQACRQLPISYCQLSIDTMSQQRDSNPRPADYKSAALTN